MTLNNNTLIKKHKGYDIHDCNILITMGVGSGLISILVLILYTSSQNVQKLYETPLMLTAIGPLMLYWVSNIWFRAHKGEIKQDPLLFAIKDKSSYLIGFLILLVVARARSSTCTVIMAFNSLVTG